MQYEIDLKKVGGEETKYSFAFDKIFGPNTQQVAIYKEVATPVIKCNQYFDKAVISGFNGTIFAYGQTGGGKTWTMEVSNYINKGAKSSWCGI